MRINWSFTKAKASCLLISICLFFGELTFAQEPQTKITDYVIFGGQKTTVPPQQAPLAPGYAVQIGSSCNIQGGSIGSYQLVKSTGNLTLGTNIYSGGLVQLANSNVVTGKITAANLTTQPSPVPSASPVISIGSSATLGNNIKVNGSIVIGGGNLSGTVTYPGSPYTYSIPGMPPGTPLIENPVILPVLPAMPAITNYPSLTAGSPFSFSSSQSLTPNRSYGDITLSGNKTLTFDGPGVYVINKILNSGTSNNFVFDFKNLTGKIIIYINGIIDLGKVKASIRGGGSESRIFLETHGTGTAADPVAFRIANGSAGNASKWVGTVWAPYAAINIGSGTGSTNITGALWSATQVNVQSGISMTFAPFDFCEEIPANAGPDQNGVATCGLTSVTLAANNPSPGTGLWSIESGTGGNVTNPSSATSTFTGIAGTAYTLRWTITNGTCDPSFDEVVIKFNQNPTTANAGPDQTSSATCGLTSVTLAANAPTVGTGSWSIVSGNGGSFSNAASPSSGFNGTAGSTYVLKWTISNSPCTLSSDNVTITFNALPANVNAGPDKAMELGTLTKLKSTTQVAGATYHWVASNGGNIASGANTDEIIVTAAGTYTLTVTAGFCSASDEALVTSKTKNLIGAELQTVYETKPETSDFFIIDDGYIMIDVIVESGEVDFVLDLLQQRTPTYPVDYGLRNFVTNGEQGHIIITGEYPIINLLNLNTLDSVINYCRPYYQPFTKVGLVSSAGDTAMRTNLVRGGFRLDGTGIKIGVISDSYATITSGTTATLPLVPAPGPTPQTFNTNTAVQDVVNGDLPGSPTNPGGYTTPVHVLQDFPLRRSDEGRAMLQIVHDVAPGAELYFRTGFFTAGDFATAIYELTEAGCDVIVDDITYITEPNLKDGIVAKAVDSVKGKGVTYFSAAGNFANKSYEADFVPADASALTGFAGKKAHDFSNGSNDLFQHVRLAPGNYTIVFQWVDDIYSLGTGLAGTKYDMDIYLTPNTDGSGLIGFNRDNTDGDPIELMPFTIPGTDSIDYNFLIIKNKDTITDPDRLKYIIYRGGMRIMEYNVGNSTLVGQGNAVGAIAVGAARYNKVPPYLPVPELEEFSSIGGTRTNDVVRVKPDIVGPDGVNTTVRMGQDYPNTALDGYSNFFGTSAAAPHAAAAAALIMHGKKKFLDQEPSLVTPDEIRSLLRSSAIDMATPGFDYSSGYGFINPDSAMRTFAAPVSYLIEMVVPPGTIPCSGTPFNITITGENFSRSTIVLLISSSGDTTRVIPTYISPSEVSVAISACVGNPEIVAYTPPKEGTNGTDGGYSNSVYFFDAEIVVSAVNIIKKYGETLVALDTVITINGKQLKDTTLTLADIGLASMTLTSTAATNSNVGTYTITPARVFDPNNPADAEFLVKYNYRFIPGAVTVNKMPLLVTPNNKTITYGEHVGDITFTYAFDETKVPSAQALKNEIKEYHDAFLPGNALAVIKDFSKSQSNGSVLTATDLANMNMMATSKAISNSRKFKLENNALVPLTDPETINVQYLVDVASESIFDYKADPTIAEFYNAYPGYTSKALLGEASLNANTGRIETPGGIVSMINGSMAQTISTSLGNKLVPMINNRLVYLLNGKFATLVNGVAVEVPNSPLVQFANNRLVYLLNGEFVPVANNSYVQLPNNAGLLHILSNSDLRQVLNNEELPLVNSSDIFQLANGKFATLVNGVPTELLNSRMATLVNGRLVYLLNGKFATLVNGTLETFVNNSEVQFINGKFATLVNSGSVGATTAGNNTAVIIDETDVDPATGNWLGAMFGINMITGLKAGTQSLVPGVLVNPNFEITYGLGTVTINKAPLTITADNKTRQYADNNPEFTFTYSGFVSGENLQTSGITGAPVLNTAATISSPVGTYPITVTNGTLVSSNYSFNPVNGTLTVTNNPCLLVRPPFNNFGSTPSVQGSQLPTSLWVNVAVKISGQLKTHGRYLSFTGGTITLKDVIATDPVTNAPITTKDLPNGMVIADIAVTSASQIYTRYDAASNTWITHVPIDFSSTSDIFISGAIINSKDGFVKKKNNANSATIVQGIFYSDTVYTDQWTYALATYRPYFDYTAIAGTAGTGKVVAINGTYRAGTPLTSAGIPISTLVNGGSGGGGNNYTGSTSSFDNFTACCLTCPADQNLIVVTSSGKVKAMEEVLKVPVTDEVRIIPNPASDFITFSYVAASTGNSKIIVYSIDGRKVLEVNNGICEAGIKYQKKMDVSKLVQGVYLVQLWTGGKIVTKKIIITQ